MTYETLGGASPASPSLASFLWAGFFPSAYVGLLLLMRRDIVKLSAANLLDGLVVVLVAAAALVAFGFHDIAHTPRGNRPPGSSATSSTRSLTSRSSA